MKMAISPTEPVAAMTMTWRIVEPVTNLALLPAGTVTGKGRSRASLGHRLRGCASTVGGLDDLLRLALLVDALGFPFRLDERFGRDRLGAPQIEPGLQSFDGLQRQPLLV